MLMFRRVGWRPLVNITKYDSLHRNKDPDAITRNYHAPMFKVYLYEDIISFHQNLFHPNLL